MARITPKPTRDLRTIRNAGTSALRPGASYRALRRFAGRWPQASWAIVEGAGGLGAPLRTVALVDDSFGQAELMRRRYRRVPPPQSGFAGFRFPREVIVLAVRRYLRYGLSYRDVEELLAERCIEVGRSTLAHTPRHDLH